MKLETTNPYGQSKKGSEFLLKSYSNNINGVSLRYFNPVGSHKSFLIGDNPIVPNNIMPILNKVANGQLDVFNIYGDDYKTNDGTAVRDYVHVMDVAHAHVMALKYLEKNTGYEVFNIGTGKGHSVLNLVDVYQRSNGLTFPTNILERRPGDVAVSYSDVSKAKNKLGFETQYTLEQMCVDSYNFARRNL
jgi:UDP-glucose 4-epimerase